MKNDTNVDYNEFINVIKRGKWTILLITIILTLIATSISYYAMKSSKATYQTKTSLVLGDKADIVDAKTMIGTFQEIANSYNIQKNASASLKGAISVENIKSSYDVTVAADAPILIITSTGKSQKDSMAMANAVSGSFTKEVVRIYPKESVKVMENSYVNGSENSKFKSSTVVLAFLLGLFLSIFIVTFKGFYDEKIRTKGDVEKYLELDVIGQMPKRRRRDI